MSEKAKFCSECGVPCEQGARFCGECGALLVGQPASKGQNKYIVAFKHWLNKKRTNKNDPSKETSKNKAVVTLLALFLGGFGAHKFYMGSWGWGIVYLVMFWCFIPYLTALVEAIKYILMTDEEFNQKAENFSHKGPFGFFW